jgi:hypothetical protein
MNTIEQSALSKESRSAGDFKPLIGVSDNHLLAKPCHSHSGTFAFTTSDPAQLPSVPAKSFRLVNSSSDNVLVTKKTIYFSRHFDESVDMNTDSPIVDIDYLNDLTPDGDSSVVSIDFGGDNSVSSSVNVPVGRYQFSTFFKFNRINADVQPVGLYQNFSSIDINHPAIALRVGTDRSWKVRVGYTDNPISSSEPAELNTWYKVEFQVDGGSANVSINKYTGTIPTQISTGGPFTSIGAGLLDEVTQADVATVSFASEGDAKITVDTLEVFSDGALGAETLIAGQSNEYYCHRNLDEYAVTGDVSGYYRS